MSKDYAKISPIRDDAKRRQRHPHQTKKSGYTLLIILGLIGMGFYYAFSQGVLVLKTDRVLPHAESTPPKPKEESTPPKPRFEFYTLLPKETVPVSQEKNASTEVATDIAEPLVPSLEEKKKPEIPAIAPTGVPAIPIHVNTSSHVSQPKNFTPVSSPKTTAPKTTEVKATPIAPKPIATANPTLHPASSPSTVVKTSPAQARYLLQVAALQQVTDVQRLKAKLTLLGFNVMIEPFQNRGQRWYRVKVGPYASQADMQKARQVLFNNHLGSIIITLPPISK